MDKKIVVESLIESLKGNLKALKDVTGAERVSCWMSDDGRISGFATSGGDGARNDNLDFFEPAQGVLKLEVF